MKTDLIFRTFLLTCSMGIALNTFGQVDDFRVLRVSIDTNRAAYEPGQHAIIVEWTPVTDTSVKRLNINDVTYYPDNWDQTKPLTVVNDVSTTTGTIIADSFVNDVNNNRRRKVAVLRMVDSINVLHTGDADKGHSTVFLRSDPDDCDEIVALKWNNYSRWESDEYEGAVEAYEVYQSVNENPFERLISLPGEVQTTYEVDSINLENIPSYLIRVVHTSGMEVFSNIHTPDVEFPGLPEYIHSTHSINDQGNISLYFEVDPASELDSFALMQSADPEGSYNQVVKTYYPEDLENFAEVVDISENENLYYYKLYAYNKCGKVRDSSNVNHPIILESTGSDRNTHHLEWNEYIGFDGIDQNGLSHYNIVGDTTIENIQITSYSLNVVDTLTIRVKAVENGPDGHSSLSNTITLYPEIQVYFEEAYRIGDPAVIGPTIENTVLDFYKIKVFNRNGIMVYTNTIEKTISEFAGHQKWDGKYKNSYVPAGTYIYHMVYSLPGSNEKHLKKGYFILVE